MSVKTGEDQKADVQEIELAHYSHSKSSSPAGRQKSPHFPELRQ